MNKMSSEIRVCVGWDKKVGEDAVAPWAFFMTAVDRDDNIDNFIDRIKQEQLIPVIRRHGFADVDFFLDVKCSSGEIFAVACQAQWTSIRPKLISQPKVFRLYVRITDVVEGDGNGMNLPMSFSLSTSASAIKVTSQQELDEHCRRAVKGNNADETVDVMRMGSYFTMLSSADNQVRSQRIFVFFSPRRGVETGSLYWCDAEDKTEYLSQSLNLSHLQAMYPFLDINLPLQKCGGAPECCFTLACENQTWYLQADSLDQMICWMSGIHHVLTKCGFDLALVEDKVVGQKRFLVKQPSRGQLTDILSADTDQEPLWKQPQTQARRDIDQNTIKDMIEGRNFCIFVDNPSQGSLERKDIYIFFEDKHPEAFKSQGALYWCPAGARIAVSSHCLPIASITNILIGKRTANFRSRIARDVPSRCCMTLISPTEHLDLQAESEFVVKSWVRVINGIKSRAGKMVEGCREPLNELTVPMQRDTTNLLPRNIDLLRAAETKRGQLRRQEVDRLLREAHRPVEAIKEVQIEFDRLRKRLEKLETFRSVVHMPDKENQNPRQPAKPVSQEKATSRSVLSTLSVSRTKLVGAGTPSVSSERRLSLSVAAKAARNLLASPPMACLPNTSFTVSDADISDYLEEVSESEDMHGFNKAKVNAFLST